MFDLVYLDPPFNTGRAQARRTLSVLADAGGDRVGFAGRRYRSRLLQTLSYDDAFADYLGFLEPRLTRARELLAPHGTLYFHIDYREAHYCKLMLDQLFGRDAFLNELIWAYDYGAKPRRRWPAKHDTILVYVRTPGAHHFDADAVEREPYMAPGLVGAEKASAASAPPTSGGTRSCPPTGARRPATRPRSPRECCAGSWRPPRGRAAGAWIRSPVRERSARSVRSSGAGSCSSTRIRWRSRSCGHGWGRLRRRRSNCDLLEPRLDSAEERRRTCPVEDAVITGEARGDRRSRGQLPLA